MKVKVWRAEMERISQIKDIGKRTRLRDEGYEKIFKYIRRQKKKRKALKLSLPMLHAHYPLLNRPLNFLAAPTGKYLGPPEGCPYCIRDKALRKAARKKFKKKKKKRG